MKSVECWRWRYRDPECRRVWRTTLALTEEEAARYPGAQRIEGSRTWRDPDPPAAGAKAAPTAFNAKSRDRVRATQADAAAGD